MGVRRSRSSGRTLGALGVLAALIAACAARGSSPALIAELGRAQSLVAAGCYRCLEEALTTYERLAAVPNGPVQAHRGAFEAAVLLAVRAKELGLPQEQWLQRARDLAPAAVPANKSQPPTAGLLAPAAYLDVLPLVPGEVSGYPPEERDQRSRERSVLWPRDAGLPPPRVALTAALATDVVAQYLALAVDCEDARARKEVKADEVLARHRTPLIRFRLALCALAPDQFTALPTADARWLETAFFSGRIEMARYPVPDVGKAAEYFAAAHEAFPESTAMTLALATARNALTEYDVALGLFDNVLGVYPTHRDALLGRVMSLSYLTRHREAIATATRMIELGTYHIGDAYYWRAWNRYSVQELPEAWDDVERATKLMVNTAVYTLAGFIAYARKEFDTAIDRFTQAFKLDRTNCEAVYAEALVHVDKQAWTVAGARFATGIGCYAAAAERGRRDLTATENADAAPTIKARKIATLRKQIDTSEHRRAQSAFNAAASYARIGQKNEASAYVDIAAEHPLLKEKATALKASIDKLPQ
jgi:tetratricopeptide (TPR) repeat protein